MPNKKTNPNSFANLQFDNSYAKLPEHFYQKIAPVPVEAPTLIQLNESLAKDLQLTIKELKTDQGATFFSGNFIAPGSEPIALAYAGHQFGHFVPQLGDGRAVLLGEVLDKKGNHFDIQLKGSGQTQFSRQGDGRAPLGPVIREYIVSEAMHALGIKTTRSLAFVTTGEPVFRETRLPGGIITRVASSHIRVGTFEYFAAGGDIESIKTLADYSISRHYPQCSEAENPYLALLEEVGNALARLVASWMCVGFIHGVMNTDNTSIAGETIDYGPCSFMDAYNPAQVFSSIDRYGRYAYINQPHIMQWNLARFAQTLLPLFDDDLEKAVQIAEEMIEKFYPQYESYWLDGMRKKIGLSKKEKDDAELVNDLLNLMHQEEADFTNTFRNLADENEKTGILDTEGGQEWKKKWKQRLDKENKSSKEISKLMNQANPAFIPRNHQIEKVIASAVEENDYSLLSEVLTVLEKPYDDQPKFEQYSLPPKPEEKVTATFCGT